jgi:hypothetical protein
MDAHARKEEEDSIVHRILPVLGEKGRHKDKECHTEGRGQHTLAQSKYPESVHSILFPGSWDVYLGGW